MGMSSLGGTLGAMGGGLLVTWQAQATDWLKLGTAPLDTTGMRTDAARVVLWTHINPDAIKANEPLYLQVALDTDFQTMLMQAQIAQ